MAPIQTHVAHCGACSGLMVLRCDRRGWYYVCCDCGVETTFRTTTTEADDDVVWVPVDRPKGKTQ